MSLCVPDSAREVGCPCGKRSRICTLEKRSTSHAALSSPLSKGPAIRGVCNFVGEERSLFQSELERMRLQASVAAE